MKKIISIALLCAMVLTCFAGCGMQKGELYVADEANVQNVAVDVTVQPTEEPGIKDVADAPLKTNVAKALAYYAAKDEAGKAASGYVVGEPWDGESSDPSWYTEAEGNVAIINTPAQMVSFREKLNEGEMFAEWTIQLGANLDFGGYALPAWSYGETSNLFKGVFDGKGYVIGNYTMELVAKSGFFGKVDGEIDDPAELKNFALVNVTCTQSGNTAGSVASVATGTANIENVYSNATITTAKKCTGGLVGGADHNDEVKNFINCEFAGNISSTGEENQVAGICALAQNATLLNLVNCKVSEGAVIYATGTATGGIFGYGGGTASITIYNCVNYGTVSGAKATSGLVGQYAATSSLTIAWSENHGDVTGTGAVAGGIVASVSKTTSTVSISNCKNTGIVKAESSFGGIVGKSNATNTTVENCTNLVMAGYQTSAVADGAYDLRFVAAFDEIEAVKAAGFVVTVNYKTADGKQVKFENKTVYASTVYTAVKGVDATLGEVTYAAEAYGADYLYTLVLENIPADYTVDAGTLEIIVTPFITDANAENVINGLKVQRGKIVIEEPAA